MNDTHLMRTLSRGVGSTLLPQLSEAAVRAVLQRNLEFAEQAFALLGMLHLSLWTVCNHSAVVQTLIGMAT